MQELKTKYYLGKLTSFRFLLIYYDILMSYHSIFLETLLSRALFYHPLDSLLNNDLLASICTSAGEEC